MVATHKIPLIAAMNNFFIFLRFLSYTYHMLVFRKDFLPLLFSVEAGIF